MEPATALSLLRMQQHWIESVKNSEGEAKLNFGFSSGHIVEARHCLVQMAEEHEATHLLMIDTDMRCPGDVPVRLLNSMLMLQAGHVPNVDKETAQTCAMTVCNASKREFPPRPVAAYGYKAPAYTDRARLMAGDQPILEKVEYAGFGIALIDMRVFSLLKPPYFDMVCPEGAIRPTGEDIFFCQKLREYELSVWVDHMASLEVAHLGGCAFTHDMTIQYRNTDVDEEDIAELMVA